MKGDKLFNKYSEYIDANKDEIVDDFCDKIKKEELGDLTLDEYSRFRFWKWFSEDKIRSFYLDYKQSVGEDHFEYDKFCEMLWLSMSKDLPDFESVMNSIQNNNIGEA